MAADKVYLEIKEILSRLENEKFTGKIVFEILHNQGGVRQFKIERTETLKTN